MISSLKVACLQVSAREYSARSENKENILRMIDRAAALNPQLMVLPECVYPAYYLSPLIVKNPLEFQQSTEDLIAEIKERAKLYKCYLALGIAETVASKNILCNSALLISPEGQEVGRSRKSFLWHFDTHWFSSGTQYPVWETELGKVGMFICADGRLPEIVRCLALQGANLLIDLTNLVTSGLEEESISNPQVEYMLPTRALENRVWIIAANKVGREAKTVWYCGKSAIFSPDGQIAKIASPYREEILYFEIPLDQAIDIDKTVDQQINIIDDRRPELYTELVQPTDSLPFYSISYSIRGKNPDPQNLNPWAAVVQIAIEEGEADFKKYGQKLEFFINHLAEQGANLIVFPESDFIFPEKGEEIVRKIKQLTKDRDLLCAIPLVEKVGESYYKTTFLIEGSKVRGKYRKTHLERTENNLFTPGNLGLPVFKTSYGYIGVMMGYEGLFPEIARVLTLKGADMIIWPSKFSGDRQINICRTRGAENKIFVVCANSISQPATGHSLITSPSGQILASCLAKTEQACLSSLGLSLSRNKEIVPGTNALLDRKPETYKLLVKPESI